MHYERDHWDVPGIKRAARTGRDRQAGKSFCGQRPRQVATDPMCARGMALRWTDNGRDMLAQVWSPAPFVRSYWLLVSSECASFPGQMMLATLQEDGSLQPDGGIYNARGIRAHLHDGSPCYATRPGLDGESESCPGCKTARLLRDLAGLVGRRVRVDLKGEPMFGGITLRWGNLREVRGDRAVFDSLEDCNGIRDGIGNPPKGWRPEDGWSVSLAIILCARAA